LGPLPQTPDKKIHLDMAIQHLGVGQTEKHDKEHHELARFHGTQNRFAENFSQEDIRMVKNIIKKRIPMAMVLTILATGYTQPRSRSFSFFVFIERLLQTPSSALLIQGRSRESGPVLKAYFVLTAEAFAAFNSSPAEIPFALMVSTQSSSRGSALVGSFQAPFQAFCIS
jgi:hypothetical protein